MLIGTRILIFAFGINLIGCASYFKRKECEKVNWYEHGRKVAMKGQRLDSDSYIKDCERVESEISYSDLDTGFKSGMASYCEPDNVYNEGRLGKKLNFTMCDNGKLKLLRSKYKEGVNDFCQPESGRRAGAQGYVYSGICPKELEKGFLEPYRKGRRVFLEGEIERNQSQVRKMEREVRDLEGDRRVAEIRLSTFRPRKERVYDKVAQSYRYEITPESRNEQQKLQTNARRITDQISSLKEKIRQTDDTIFDLKKELRAL